MQRRKEAAEITISVPCEVAQVVRDELAARKASYRYERGKGECSPSLASVLSLWCGVALEVLQTLPPSQVVAWRACEEVDQFMGVRDAREGRGRPPFLTPSTQLRLIPRYSAAYRCAEDLAERQGGVWSTAEALRVLVCFYYLEVYRKKESL